MSGIELRLITESELESAILLEQKCYAPEAAATLSGFYFRYRNYRPFFWSAWLGSELIGITNGVLTSQKACGDDMKGDQPDSKDGSNFCVLTVAVDQKHRRQGVGAQLLRKLIMTCEANGIETIILMCERHLIPFYEVEQFKLLGVSASTHGGIVWYEMSRTLHTMKHLTE
ncbi:GNAT family N-acetyltransferase [Paenibacillus prosopidis]|uniref:Acetyltransferase (GNAT) family protein n=1 Tax=Paenibacillus prosopidis TaxID=630520 RepID=A0A368W596_9BACL|nr:GNAT family N-acetyltransferase [Paenibacillus prosopidis]RCW50925.1 acetyltransferase (GNAT) family protein [Paenibacillus prosopidis]